MRLLESPFFTSHVTFWSLLMRHNNYSLIINKLEDLELPRYDVEDAQCLPVGWSVCVRPVLTRANAIGLTWIKRIISFLVSILSVTLILKVTMNLLLTWWSDPHLGRGNRLLLYEMSWVAWRNSQRSCVFPLNLCLHPEQNFCFYLLSETQWNHLWDRILVLTVISLCYDFKSCFSYYLVYILMI